MNEWGYHSPIDYLNAAKTSSSEDELAFLAASAYDFARLAVAENPRATAQILLDLVPEDVSTWNAQKLVGAIAAHQQTPIEAFQKIALGLRPYLNLGRGNEMAGESIVIFCNNSRVPLEVIKLALDPSETSPRIRKKIANNCSRREVLEMLSTDPSDVVRSRAQRALIQK